jgi:DNA-binding NarL/FixJ family response regulator
MRPLSARQRNILKDILAGASTKEIARQLDVSAAMVKADLREIVRELNVQSDADGELSH